MRKDSIRLIAAVVLLLALALFRDADTRKDLDVTLRVIITEGSRSFHALRAGMDSIRQLAPGLFPA